MSDDRNYSPFHASGLSWGESASTQPSLVAELRQLRQCMCAGGLLLGSTQTQFVSTASELRASTSYGYRYMAYIEYLETPEGGGGGWFVFKADNTDADDGADTLKPDLIAADQAGRWKRLPPA